MKMAWPSLSTLSLRWGSSVREPTTRGPAQMLQQLAGYYHKEPDRLFTVRIAQGLVHIGKGTIGLNPFFSDRSITSRPARKRKFTVSVNY
ncbi:hypothetical protein B0H14DRAFT_1710991 [Mycena olivaceomarginata]|nr:hypothetical protein B0H14DRAFT_1710991 [Mycena olivaceomarginata]